MEHQALEVGRVLGEEGQPVSGGGEVGEGGAGEGEADAVDDGEDGVFKDEEEELAGERRQGRSTAEGIAFAVIDDEDAGPLKRASSELWEGTY